nr:HAMP domain-containing sensor histidine kinase [Janthinobacterium agaricidamnosum]
MQMQQRQGWQWQRDLVRPLLRFQHGIDRTPSLMRRIAILGLIGCIGMPLYYVLWHYCFPQHYESLLLRSIGALLFLPALWARRLGTKWFNIYLIVGLTYELPFFFTYLFLMNQASLVWCHSLLLALIVLFHFDVRIAALAYVSGTALACALFAFSGDAAFMLNDAVLQQVPVHWFAIAVLSALKIGRNALAQERLAGLSAGLATVAHELRTPLSSVDANARGLQRMLQQVRESPPAAPERELDRTSAQEALTRIQFEVRHMNHMIDLFLLSASVVNRNLQPSEAVAMSSVVDAMMRRYPFIGPAQKQSVVVELRGDFTFAGQSELCVVVLLNLLRNALKAIQRAGKGRVRIVIDGAPRDDGIRRMPRLLFIDTGCGVAEQRLPLIFQRFYSYPAHNGTGIGLALCKEIVEAWQARIRCISRETAYAIFVLEFPVPPTH